MGKVNSTDPVGSREELNRLKWTGGLEHARVTILHRGAPSDKRVVEGREIIELGRGFVRVGSPGSEVEIPYHRILRIEARGKLLWQKRAEV